MHNEPIDEWEKKILSWRVPSDQKLALVNYMHNLKDKEFPVIFDFDHLAKMLSIRPQVLADMVYSTQKFYREFTIPKKSGDESIIHAPLPSLLYVQKWIYSSILQNFPIRSHAFG